MTWPTWPPRDWRMLLALFMLCIAGAGAWLLAKWSLDKLVMLSAALGQVWPVAYYSYGSLTLLAIPSLGFALVVGLKAFKVNGPGDTSMELTGDGGNQAAVITRTETTVIPSSDGAAK